MDERNSRDVLRLSREAPRACVSRLQDYVPDALERNVPTPYFTGDFDEVCALVEAECTRLLEHIRQELEI